MPEGVQSINAEGKGSISSFLSLLDTFTLCPVAGLSSKQKCVNAGGFPPPN